MKFKELMPYLIAIVVILCAAVLRYGDKISEANLVHFFMLILGYLFGGVTAYALMRSRHRK